MEISVIIPTYKPDSYLYECLLSISKQDFDKNKYEVIVVLNGCCEPWFTAIVNYINENMSDMNTCVFQTDTPGVSNARNKGIESAKGVYIAFVDDDDILSPTYLSSLYKYADTDIVSVSNTLSFVHSVERPISEQSNMQKAFTPGRLVDLNSGRSYLSGPCMKLFHRDIIGDARYDIFFKNGEDTLFMFEISCRIKKLQYADSDAIYYRRIREGSATKAQKADMYNRLVNLREACTYLRIFLKHPFKYDIHLLASRVGGALYAMIFLHKIIKKRNK